MKKYNVIILAGGEKGPLSNTSEYHHKTMIPIHGKPMIDWVVESFHNSPYTDNIIVIGPEEIENTASIRYITKRLNEGLNVVQSLLKGINYIKNHIDKNNDENSGYLISFGDAVYLTPAIINDTIDNIQKNEVDMVLHYVEEYNLKKANITPQRPYIPINGKNYMDSTIYYIKNFPRITSFIPKLFEFRKYRNNPEKLFELLDCKEKTIPGIETGISNKLSSKVNICLSTHPELVMDVDTQEDLELAKNRLKTPWIHNYKKVKVIYNPKAGNSAPLSPVFKQILGIKQRKLHLDKNINENIELIKKYFIEYGINAEYTGTEYAGHATIIAKECAKKNYDLVIGVGGDGTINEVMNGLVGSDTVLGIIPLGTANVMGIQLNIPGEIKAACQVIAEGNQRKIDVGKVKNRYFIAMAGVGFDAHVIKKTDSKIKKLFGALAYIFVALAELISYKFRKIIVRLDNQPIPRKGYFIIIGNSKYYGGNLVVAKYADISDGYLDVVIFKHKNIFTILKTILNLRSGNIEDDMNMEYFQCKKVEILNKHHAIHVDAEYYCNSKAKIKVVPNALNIAY